MLNYAGRPTEHDVAGNKTLRKQNIRKANKYGKKHSKYSKELRSFYQNENYWRFYNGNKLF